MKRFTRPPPSLRRAALDNLTLVPGNLLPFKEEWQALASNLPQGSALLILPASDSPHRKAWDTIAHQLEADGYKVTILPAEHFTPKLSSVRQLTLKL